MSTTHVGPKAAGPSNATPATRNGRVTFAAVPGYDTVCLDEGVQHAVINGWKGLPEAGRLQSAPRSYTTRRVPVDWLAGFAEETAPQPGDLVLARVEKLGQHRTIHLPNGRRQTLFEGDEVLVAYANRYAPDQFEAEVPDSLEACHLVASGGVAAKAVSWHQRMNGPTRIRPIGLVSRHPGGKPLNVAEAALARDAVPTRTGVPVIAVAGTNAW